MTRQFTQLKNKNVLEYLTENQIYKAYCIKGEKIRFFLQKNSNNRNYRIIQISMKKLCKRLNISESELRNLI